MSVQQKAITGNDIVEGIAAIGGHPTRTYDNTQRTLHFASGDSLSLFQILDGRYKYHGGTGGSGAWEQ